MKRADFMKLHVHTEYALQILQQLHKHKGVLHTAASISISTGIAYPLVVKVAKKLKEKGLLKSIQGRRGGYQLGRPAHKINAYDVFVCMEGELQTHFRHSFVRDIQEKIIQDMTAVSITEMTLDNAAERLNTGLRYTVKPLEKQAEKLYRVEAEDKQIHMIPFGEIILIQSGLQQGLLELHRAHGLLEFRGMISRIAGDAPEFFRSHMSMVVNISHIKEIDVEKREIALTNGRVVPIAKQKIKGLLHLTAAWAKAVG